MTAAEQIESTFREEYGRVLAALLDQLGAFPLAEDALQDALVAALERWEIDGVPAAPAPGHRPPAPRGRGGAPDAPAG